MMRDDLETSARPIWGTTIRRCWSALPTYGIQRPFGTGVARFHASFCIMFLCFIRLRLQFWGARNPISHFDLCEIGCVMSKRVI
jgi:hypothetical protein